MLVEVGMVLAAKKNNIWFVKKGQQLPFLLRGAANASGESGLPNIGIYQYDRIDAIVTRIKTMVRNSSRLHRASISARDRPLTLHHT